MARYLLGMEQPLPLPSQQRFPGNCWKANWQTCRQRAARLVHHGEVVVGHGAAGAAALPADALAVRLVENIVHRVRLCDRVQRDGGHDAVPALCCSTSCISVTNVHIFATMSRAIIDLMLRSHIADQGLFVHQWGMRIRVCRRCQHNMLSCCALLDRSAMEIPARQ